MRLLPLALLLPLAFDARAQERPDPAQPDFALTVYSSAQPGQLDSERLAGFGPDLPGYAVVRDQRRMELQRGRSEVRFPHVAARMDPSTVTFESLTDPDGTRVVEQNYQFDLVGRERLLERYVGQVLSVEQTRGDVVHTTSGVLLSSEGGLTLQLASGELATLTDWSAIRFPALPGGLIAKPTLLWLIDAERGGTHEVRVSYQARGMTWWADYNGVLDTSKGCTLDLGAWVTLVNQSGAGFPDARLKLVAGDVQRIEPPPPPMAYMRAQASAVAEDSFQESALFEYHLYTLGRRTDLPDNSTKQLELFPQAVDVPCSRQLVFTAIPARPLYSGAPALEGGFAGTTEGQVAAWLEFQNRSEGGLGMPLPAGRLRVSQLDPADRSLEFIGEDVIGHTPRNETLRVKLGNAFDVVGERRQVAWQVDSKARRAEESLVIELRNRKEEAVEVLVRDYLYRWSGWEITESSHEPRKRDALTVDFPVRVPADGTVQVSYTVRYTW